MGAATLPRQREGMSDGKFGVAEGEVGGSKTSLTTALCNYVEGGCISAISWIIYIQKSPLGFNIMFSLVRWCSRD